MTDTGLKNMAEQVLNFRKLAANVMIDKEVRLLRGRYAGRTGKITNVIPSTNHGLAYCVMVYKEGSKEFLNNRDSQTRTYWPLDAFVEV